MAKPSKKELIIKRARDSFSTRGYELTSLESIASECGITKPAIYYHFKDKAALYEVVMEGVLSEIYEEIVSMEKCCISPLADLEAFIKTYAKYCDNNRYLPSLLLRELSDSGAHLPEMMFASLRQLFSLLSKILDEGKEKDIFHNVEPMVIHFMIVGTINLLITTHPLRQKAAQMQNELNTCSDCDIDYIADYIFQKTKLILEVSNEENTTCP